MFEFKKIIKEEIDKMFLKEANGVPEEIKKVTKILENEIYKNFILIDDKDWQKVYDSNNKKIDGAQKSYLSISLDSTDFFFTKINFKINLIKITDDKISEEIIKKSNRGQFLERYLYFNRTTKKIDDANFELFLCFRNNDILNSYAKNLIFHELMHLYRAYHEKLTKFKDTKSKDDVYNSLSLVKTNNLTIKKIIHIIYCMLNFENDANIGGLYSELMNSSADSIENLKKEVYNTVFYSEYMVLLKEPEKYINQDEINNLTNEDFDIINKKIKEESVMMNIKTLKNYDFYFRGNKELYFKKLFDKSKELYLKLLKRIDKVVIEVHKDKNPSLIKERYNPDFLTPTWGKQYLK